MSIFEYDAEKETRLIREAEFAEGKAEGFAEGKAKGFAEGEAKGFAEGEVKGEKKGETKGEARTQKIYQYAQAGRTPIEIAEKMGIPEEKVREILAPVELD